MNETWTRWHAPIKDLAQNYFLDSIDDNLKTLTLILSNEEQTNPNVKVTFKAPVYTYKIADEGLRIQKFDTLSYLYGGEFYAKWTFFQIKNSSYIKWLTKESNEILEENSLIHFSIFTLDVIIDIITASEPTVETINRK